MTQPLSATTGELTPLKRAFLALEEAQARIAALEGAQREPIAIVGIGCRLPGGVDSPESFWRLLDAGRDAIGPVPDDRWDAAALHDPNPDTPGRIATTGGGFLERIDGFDPLVFGIAPREAATMDPQQRLLLEVAWEALEHANIAPDALERSATGVYVGVTASDYAYLQLKTGNADLLDAHFTSGIAHSIHSGRLSYLLGLQGPSLTIDTACSSSLVAVHLACAALRAGECRTALAGGVNLMLSPDLTIALSRSRMLAPDGRCKAFAASADGFGRGEGCGVVVLKTLSDARAAGDTVLAVIRGSAVNQDGASSSLTAPNGPAQEAVIREALVRAGVSPADVSYIEAHGTGTQLGDPIEVRALGAVFGEKRKADEPLIIGSVKTNLGHLEAAAGITGLIKVVLALSKHQIPRHLHCDVRNPHVAWDELPLTVPTQPVPWCAGPRRRIAGISSFGFSGTNAHVVVEEAPLEVPAHTSAANVALESFVMPLSAASEGALRELARRTCDFLQDHDDSELANVCFTAGAARAHLSARAIIAARSMRELRDRLRSLAEGRDVAGVWVHTLARTDKARVAFLFTGQGAQYAGMARRLYECAPVFRGALDRCAEILNGELPAPLFDVLWGSASGRLDETACTQPALAAVEYALSQLWASWGITPLTVIGHSIGEYVGACLAGVMSLDQMLKLVAARGRLMQALPSGGAMAAIAADEATVASVAAPFGDTVSIAAVNAPDQTVISGQAADVRAVAERFAAQGVRVRPLTVSHAFHSALLDPMLDGFEREVAQVSLFAPGLRVISNVTGQIADAAQMTSPSYWRRHARHAVRFADGMRTVASLRPDVCLEVGPHPSLLSAVEHAFSGGSTALIATLRKGRDDWEHLLEAAGTLWLRGGALDWRAVYAAARPRRIPLPTYPWQRARYWFHVKPNAGAAHGRATGHPLLGTRLRSAGSEAVYESAVCASAPAWVGAHRVQGQVVMPGTGYLETLRAAAANAFATTSVCVSDVTIREAMLLGDGNDDTRIMQVIVEGRGDSRAARCCTIDARDEASSWTEHATATVQRASALPLDAPSLSDVRVRCTAMLGVDEFYANLAGRGLNFGSALRTVRSIRHAENEALADVALDDETARGGSGYGIHPVLLDGCLQAVAAAMWDDGDDALFLPVGIGQFTLYGRAHSTCACHAAVSGTGATRRASVTVYDSSGEIIATLRDVRLARADSNALARLGERWLDRALYDVQWMDSPSHATLAASPSFAPSAIARHATDALLPLVERSGLGTYDDMHLRLEELCGEYVECALARLGWRPAPGTSFDVDELRGTLRVLPRHRRLFARLVAIAEEVGLVERHAAGWRVLRLPRQLNVSSSAEQLAREWEDVGELEMTVRAGEKLAEALRGEVDPHQLLFPAGSTAAAERMYRDSPPARVMNGLVTSAIVPLARAATPERPLRILEIGAGTGGTTAHLLPQLPPDRVAYTFTDIGPLFVSRARERFESYPFTRFGVFDAERDPEAQGLSTQAYDVIVATNVIHATADLRRTLGRAQRLLAPGGVLVMVEVTEPQRWFDLTVGLTDGWWSFTDTDLRPDYATLSRGQWLHLLGECGFENSLALPEDVPHVGSLSRQAILVSRAPASVSARRWLIYADAAGTMRDLAQALRARGDECVLVRAGASYEFDGTAAEIDPLARADVERLLSEWRTAGSDHAFHGVVHGSSLPATVREFVSQEALSAAHRIGVTSALHLAQSLLLGSVPVSGLWLVTRGAQSIDEMDGVLDPTHATVWGLGATLALEHPELRTTCVDLGADSEEDITALLTELDAARAETPEPRVAYRRGRRRVARLASLRRQPRGTRSPWRLQRDEGGSLDQLRVEPLVGGSRALGPNEVEIGVEATGVNFKDVLNALGMYPGNPGPLGGECAGRVTRVGAAVTHVRPGDRVMAVAPGSFASFVVARDTLVQAIPDHMPMEEGATFPIAYLTAAFCLEHLAGVRADDCVLVHAAAGGVGMAAVKIAQRAGARVIATAGSPWKRDVVRSLGVEHVLDSRSTTFASEVLRLTDGRGADVVLNSLSGDMVAASFRALAANGRFIEIGKRDIRSPADVAVQAPSARYHVVDWGETEVREPALIGDMFARLAEDLHAGRLASLPRHVFDLDDVGQAFRFMAQARHIGRIAVRHGAADAAPVARRDGTYLVTGGLSGLGLAAARWLGEHGAGRIVLIGRRGITAETEPVLAFLRERGVTVVAAAVDVSDEAALVSLLRQLRATGAPIRGVLHSAGVLDDAAILSQDRQHFERVFAPKVTGTYLLDRHTRGDPLDWFVAFSSIAAVLGARGQANHSAANAFLDAVALERRRRGLPALSINWGPWSEIGAAVDRGAAERLAERGVTALTTAQGFQALQRLMSTSGAGRAVVFPVDWKRFAATGGAMPLLHDVLRRDAESSQHEIGATTRAPASPHRAGEPSLKEQLAVTPTGRRRPTVLAFVRDRALRALGLDPSRAVDPRTPLGELGLDSLLAVELRNTLATALGQTLPATLLFDYPTIDALTDFILTDVLGLGDDAAPITAATHTLPVAAAAQLVTTVEDLSDDEVERLIASRANRK